MDGSPNWNNYPEWLREDMAQMIQMIELTDLQKHYLLSRWLDQVIWMEYKAQEARDRYFLLRRTTLIGGAIVPALAGLNAVTGIVGGVVYWLIFVISLTVAIAGALEQFHNYSDRWRHYRAIVEELKVIGWQFFQLAGRFKDYKTHKLAYISFVNVVEDILQREVKIFVSNINQDRKEEEAVSPAVPSSTLLQADERNYAHYN